MTDELNPGLVAELQDKTDDQIRQELLNLTAEERRLDLEIKREKVSEIRSKRQNILDQYRMKAVATAQFLAQRAAQQAHCNHRKGGRGPDAVMRGQGDSAMYSVIKHKLPGNYWMVLCQRCGKEWHQGSQLLNEPQTPGFQDAIQFPTDNTASGSSIFLFEKEQE